MHAGRPHFGLRHEPFRHDLVNGLFDLAIAHTKFLLPPGNHPLRFQRHILFGLVHDQRIDGEQERPVPGIPEGHRFGGRTVARHPGARTQARVGLQGQFVEAEDLGPGVLLKGLGLTVPPPIAPAARHTLGILRAHLVT